VRAPPPSAPPLANPGVRSREPSRGWPAYATASFDVVGEHHGPLRSHPDPSTPGARPAGRGSSRAAAPCFFNPHTPRFGHWSQFRDIKETGTACAAGLPGESCCGSVPNSIFRDRSQAHRARTTGTSTLFAANSKGGRPFTVLVNAPRTFPSTAERASSGRVGNVEAGRDERDHPPDHERP